MGNPYDCIKVSNTITILSQSKLHAIVEPEKRFFAANVSGAKVLAANVIDIRSFAAVAKSIGSFRAFKKVIRSLARLTNFAPLFGQKEVPA
jgi:hypothetical protein